RDQRLYQRPFCIRQIARIAQTRPGIAGAVLGSPHEPPRKAVPEIDSQSRRAGQQPALTGSEDSGTFGTDTQTSAVTSQGSRRRLRMGDVQKHASPFYCQDEGSRSVYERACEKYWHSWP